MNSFTAYFGPRKRGGELLVSRLYHGKSRTAALRHGNCGRACGAGLLTVHSKEKAPSQGAPKTDFHMLVLQLELLEATSGIEPLYKGFADPRLTTWLRRRAAQGWFNAPHFDT